MRAEQYTVASTEAPYVGPRTYGEGDHEFFFGRERESAELLSLLMARRLVLFYAQSGAGKSSLINASLIRDLENHRFEVLPVARVISPEAPPDLEVDNIFSFSLMLGLDESDRGPARFATMELSEFLLGLAGVDGKFVYVSEEEEEGEDLAVAAAADGQAGYLLDEIRPRVLIIDQFEELFTTHHEHWEEREGFFQQLNRAMEEDPYLFVLLAMREDYVGRISPYAALCPGELRTRYYMQRMDEGAALKAIRKPAQKAGRPFSRGNGGNPDVAGELVKKLRQIQTEQQSGAGEKTQYGEFVEPVQLQVVCYQLWDRLKDRPGAEITLDDLEAVSGGLDEFVSSALSDFYQQSIDAVLADPDVAALATQDRALAVSQRKIRAWFDHELITDSKTRSQVHRGEVTTGRAPNQLPNQAVRVLEKQFIIRSETRAGSTWYELVHDTFVDPILASNGAWREEQLRTNPLAKRAQQWNEIVEQNLARAEKLLYRDRQLADAWLEVDLRDADPTVLTFLKASKEAQSHRAAEDARREAERAREREARQRRWKSALGILAAVAIVATVFAGYFAIQERDARDELDDINKELVRNNRDLRVASVAKDGLLEDLDAERENLRVVAQELVKKNQDLIEQREATNREKERAEQAHRQLQAENRRYDALELARAAQRDDLDLDHSLLLAVESVRLSLYESHILPPMEAEDALHRGLLQANELGPMPLGGGLAGPGLFLGEHGDGVLDVAWSPDGTILATASSDRTAILWDAASGEVLRILDGHLAEVLAVAFDSDGERLATAGQDGIVRIWDLDTGEMLQRMEGQGAGFYQLGWSPDGAILATGGEAGALILWDAASGEELLTWSGPEFELFAVAFSSDGERLAAAWMDGSVRLWDVADLASEPLALPRHDSAIYDVAWSPDGNTLAAASGDGTAILWDVASGEPRLTLPGEEGGLYAVAFSPDGRWLATSGPSGIARVWNALTGEELFVLSEHEDAVFRLAFSPDGRRLATASLDGTVRVADLDEEVWARGLSRAAYLDFAGGNLAVASENGIVTVWDTSLGEMAYEIVASGQLTVTDVAFAPDGSQFLTSAVGDFLQAWGSGSGQVEPVASLQIPVTLTQVVEVTLAGDGSRLAARGDGFLAVWDTASGRMVWGQPFTPEPASARPEDQDRASEPAANEAAQAVASADESGPAESSIGTKDRIMALGGHGTILAVATTSEATTNKAITQVRLWSVDDGQELPSQSLDGRITALALSPHATRVAAASHRGDVWVWGIWGDDVPLKLLHGEAVTALAFSPGGQRLAAATTEEIRIWDITNRQAKSVSLPVGKDISDLAFSPDGRHLAAATPDAAVYLFPLDLEVLLAQACEAVSRNLKQVEWQDHARAIEFPQTCPQQPLHDTVILELVRTKQEENARTYIARANRRAREAGFDLNLVPDVVMAGAYIDWAWEFVDKNRHDDAWAELEEALRLWAREFVDKNRHEDAWAELEEALRLVPGMGPEQRAEVALISAAICQVEAQPDLRGMISPACELATTLAVKVTPTSAYVLSDTLALVTADTWPFYGQEGQWLTISMDKVSPSLDSVLDLLGPDGEWLVGDDDGGTDWNAWIRAYRLPADGFYSVEARDWAGAGGDYALGIYEIAPGGGTLGDALTVEGQVTGLAGAYWQVEAGFASTVTITATHNTTGLYLDLYASDGQLLESMDLDGSDSEAVLVASVPVSYTVVVLGADKDVSGAFTLSLAQGEPMTLQAEATSSQIEGDTSSLPQACGMTDDNVDYGSIVLGSVVLLGGHSEVGGDANWAPEMALYVGELAQVVGLWGVDGSGCPVVRVDADGGAYLWRIRDMQLVE